MFSAYLRSQERQSLSGWLVFLWWVPFPEENSPGFCQRDLLQHEHAGGETASRGPTKVHPLVGSLAGHNQTIRRRSFCTPLAHSRAWIGENARFKIAVNQRGRERNPRNHPEISSQKVAECRFPYDFYGRDRAPFSPLLGEGFWGNFRRPLVLPAPLVYC